MAERNEREAQLLENIPSDGRPIGNSALIRTLGWPEDQYWDVRSQLISDGTLERGRGRGGSIRRIVAPPSELAATPATEPDVGGGAGALATQAVYEREASLYRPMRDVIAKGWAKDRQDTPLTVEITAAQGRRATGGRWSRPDIVSVSVKTYLHVPGKYIELTTFEVKPCDTIDVSAVYEALAHQRGATHSYVLLHVPDDQLASLQDVIGELCEVARFHGIGVIVAGDPSEYTTWEEREVAERREPDPDRLERFISTQLSAADSISKAVR